jgi:hypothetical protein
MSDHLKNQLIKLGHTNPELRDHIRPVLDVLHSSNYRIAAASPEVQEFVRLVREMWKATQKVEISWNRSKDKINEFLKTLSYNSYPFPKSFGDVEDEIGDWLLSLEDALKLQ